MKVQVNSSKEEWKLKLEKKLTPYLASDEFMDAKKNEIRIEKYYLVKVREVEQCLV